MGLLEKQFVCVCVCGLRVYDLPVTAHLVYQPIIYHRLHRDGETEREVNIKKTTPAPTINSPAHCKVRH